MSRRLLLAGALALGACTATHPLPADAGREPVIDCLDPSRDCDWGATDCCEDRATGDRVCCSADRLIHRSDGSIQPMCGDGPACVDYTTCCAVPAELYPDVIERCTDDRYLCDGIWDYGLHPRP